MKRFLMMLVIVLTSVSLFAETAEARRFGGGGSFGKQRSMAPQQAQKAPAPAQGATPAKPAGNKWLGPLAGLAIGAGLFALLSSAGLDGALGGILLALLVAGALMFLVAKFRKQAQGVRPVAPQPMRYAAAGAPVGEAPPADPGFSAGQAGLSRATAEKNIPADFPEAVFLRSAKTTFIRLQAANDRKDLDDIREYTTPEMFAEISMQVQERGDAPQKTDVLAISGELLEVVEENDLAIASVRFTGQLSENNGTPESVDEIWHVQKNLLDDKSVWLLAGIQQTVLH